MDPRWWALFLAVALSGCLNGTSESPETEGNEGASSLDSDGDGASDEYEKASGSDPNDPDSTPPRDPHGEPTRSEGSVTTKQSGNGYQASMPVTISNGIGDATHVLVAMGVSSGVAEVHGAARGGYLMEAVVHTRGTTQAQAEACMDEEDFDVTDSMTGSQVELSFGFETPQVGGVSINGMSPNCSFWLDLVLHVPADALYALDLEASSGSIEVTGVDGTSIAADVSSGDVDLAGAWDDVTLSASSGDLDFEGRKRATGQGTFTAEVSSGSIDITIARGAAFGYDVVADVSSGDIDIDIEDAVEIDDSSDRHVQTDGYEDRSHRFAFDLEASSGDIDVEHP